jgi:archaellum biogenesis ATPase FlaH
MIARGSVTLICSESGTGKTWLGYYLAGCVAHGTAALGRPVQNSKVLYLDGENPLYTIQQRLKALGIDETGDLIVWGGWNTSPPEGPQSLLVIEFARRHKPLIIIDSLIEFHTGSEQSSTETRAFMRHLRALANLGATVVALHHTGKAETAKFYRGSSDIKAAVDTAYLLESVGEESNRLCKLSLKCFKGRLVPGQNFGFEFREGEGFVACDLPTRTKTVESVIEDILEAHPRSNQKEVVRLGRERGCKKGQLEHSLRIGYWHREYGPHNSIFYSLPEPADFDQEDEK